MIKFDTYRLLNESLGMHSLGVRPVQSLGIQSNMPGFGEGGLPPELSAKGKGKPPFGKPPMGGEEDPMAGDDMGDDPMAGDMGGEEDPMGDDMGGEDDPMGADMGGEEGGEGSVEDRIAELEAELAALKAEIGGGDEDLDGDMGDLDGDDADADLDHDDDMGGDMGDEDPMGDDDMGGDGEEGEEGDKPNPFGGKKKPLTPFMKKGMKKECSDNKDGGMVGKGGEGPVFMMKKAKKCGDGDKQVVLGKSKKCDASGKMPAKNCKKCSSNMKKEDTGYERPKPLDFSEDAWLKSIQNQLAQQDVHQKFSDGMRKFTTEDLLLAPGTGVEAVKGNPGPGEVGYAPTGPVGGDLGFTAEAVQDIISRLKRLEGN